MTITPGNLNITIYTSRTFNTVLTWTDSSGNPVNLTGYTASLEARYNLTDASPFITLTTSNGGITLGGSAGTITLSMSPAATASLTPGQGVYDLEMTALSGEQDTLLEGIVTVQESVTR